MKSYRFRILLFLLLFLAGLNVKAQALTWNWASHDSLGTQDFINIVADPNGYIYAGGTDKDGLVLTKYKPDGIKIWSKTESATMLLNLSIDAAGNLYITAQSTSFGGQFIHTAKLDSAGNHLWDKGIFAMFSPTDGPTGALFTGAADAAGNTYMSGNFTSQSGLAQFDTIPLGNLAADNYFLAKYNSAGKIQWVRFFNHPVYAIACGPQGSYFVECGTYFQHYAANGTLVWQQSFSGIFDPSIHLGPSNKLKTDVQGNLYVLGNKIAKYNSTGTLAWVKNNLTTTTHGFDFSLTSAGNILLTGFFSGNLALGNGVPNLTSGAANALFVAQISGTDGNANWAKQAYTSGAIYGEAFVSLPNGDYVITGNFNGGITFDQFSLSGKGVYVAKLSGSVLGIAETLYTGSFQLYPNPATSGVTISNSDLRNATVEIYNITGQKIYQERTRESGSLAVSTENWPNGIYAVKILSEGKSITKKLIISH
jgi:hypothetical protein